jgi:enoyl-CoA hydratase/carnithine racemase
MENDLIVDNDFFSVESIPGVAILRITGNPLYKLIDLQAKAALFDCMENINNRDDLRVMVIFGAAKKHEYEDYLDFFHRIRGPILDRKSLHLNEGITYLAARETLAKFCNAVNQLALKIVSFNKFVIHVDSGLIISPFMNLSLACDYRIVDKNSVYKNPYLELGLVPKGGSAFFLTRLTGYQNTLKVLLADSAIAADEALRIGLVDQVVPTAQLYETAIKTARRYAEFPPSSLAGIKTLMNCPTDDLEYCLKREDELFLRIVNSGAFINKIKASTAIAM